MLISWQIIKHFSKHWIFSMAIKDFTLFGSSNLGYENILKLRSVSRKYLAVSNEQLFHFYFRVTVILHKGF